MKQDTIPIELPNDTEDSASSSNRRVFEMTYRDKKTPPKDSCEKYIQKKRLRKITESTKWKPQFQEDGLKIIESLYIRRCSAGFEPIYQGNRNFESSDTATLLESQIHNKLSSYRNQDLAKDKYDSAKFVTIDTVIQKLHACQLLCFYCKEPVLLFYSYVHDPKQWTLERLNNQYGHNTDNVEIACLSCNIRRKTIYFERYLLTKQLRNIRKE